MHIHLVACGNNHEQLVDYYELFGSGRLKRKRHFSNLIVNNTKPIEKVRVSRCGTTAGHRARENGACVIDFSIDSAILYKNSLFGKPIYSKRWTPNYWKKMIWCFNKLYFYCKWHIFLFSFFFKIFIYIINYISSNHFLITIMIKYKHITV